jgi:hypothetical protein
MIPDRFNSIELLGSIFGQPKYDDPSADGIQPDLSAFGLSEVPRIIQNQNDDTASAFCSLHQQTQQGDKDVRVHVPGSIGGQEGAIRISISAADSHSKVETRRWNAQALSSRMPHVAAHRQKIKANAIAVPKFKTGF